VTTVTTPRPVPDIDDLSARLTGFRLPGGEVRVPPHEAWLGHEAMGVTPPDGGVLDPLWILVVGLRGMGIGIGGIIDLAEGDPAAGVLFGELGLVQREVLRTDTTYRVSGRITSVVRRTGRRAGTFDQVSFVLELHAGDEPTAHATVTSDFLFMRAPA
jgi:hypothetical protein